VAPFTEAELLAVWETGLDQSPVARALTLAAAACGGEEAALADLPLGRRDALLLGLRERCFGPRLSSEVQCPRCDERLELTLTTADIRVDGPAAGAPGRVEVGGVEVTFRPPTSRDLLALDPGSPDARHRLVAGCVLTAGTAPESLGDDVLETVAGRLGDADPQADVVLALTCTTCRHEWQAPFDVAGYLWTEVDAYVRRLLYDIHSLAAAYGWSEGEVLAVSPVRRQFYLAAAPA
jgi:hypothetical protein